MKRVPRTSKTISLYWLGIIGVIAAALLRFFSRPNHGQPTAAPARVQSLPNLVGITNSPLASVARMAVTPAPSGKMNTVKLPLPPFPWFQLHPFPAAKSSGPFAWTAEDGMDTNVIRQLAHNELEYQRMVNENHTIYRRQLVYHSEGFTVQAQQAMQSGQGIQQLTLPGLDGQELPVTVTKTDFESGGDKGIFYGKLAGDPESMVTLAFINGWESFTVFSRLNQIFLHAEARAPGELVVKKIDPDTYGNGMCGN